MSAAVKFVCANCQKIILFKYSWNLSNLRAIRSLKGRILFRQNSRDINNVRTLSSETVNGQNGLQNTNSSESLKNAETFFRKRMKIKTGSLARFADGAAVVEIGNTAVLVTAVGSKETSTASFMPLTVDYRQKAAAAGRIPTNHLRREMGPSEKEILTSRVIDRSIRPMFPSDYNREVQVTCNLLAVDGENDPDVASINAASAALWMSNIPWNGPIGAVRVGLKQSDYQKKGEIVVNPTRLQQEDCLWNLIVVANRFSNIVMLEGSGENLPCKQLKGAIDYGSTFAAAIANMIIKDCSEFQKQKQTYSPPYVITDVLTDSVQKYAENKILSILGNRSHDKISRDAAINNLRHETILQLKDQFLDQEQLLHEAYSVVVKKLFRGQILNSKSRCDGRSLTEVRQISSKVNLYEPLHGSALFQRGQTQVLCTVTFDSLESASKSDPVSIVTGALPQKNFMLHYEFPSFSTNEIKRPADTRGRRELGHGALAERALRPVIPENFPFCIRLTSEVLESNGSSSMASVCGGSLALMDAGVPLAEPLAGVAMGLVTKWEGGSITDYSIMTDILVSDRCPLGYLLSQGIEDYMGDMDFKIAGSRTGFTAMQLDLKIPGVPKNIINSALKMSADGLNFVLDKMQETMSEPRKEKKPNHPVVENLQVLPAERARFLGIGGYNLRKLRSDTGVTITPMDDSTYEIFAPNQSAMNEAKEIIKDLLVDKRVPELEFNAVYQAKITEIRDNGVMVQLHPSMDPVLLHNSQLDHRPISHPSSLGFEVGQVISVKYFGRDPASGRMRISRKVITAASSKSIDFIKENLISDSSKR